MDEFEHVRVEILGFINQQYRRYTCPVLVEHELFEILEGCSVIAVSLNTKFIHDEAQKGIACFKVGGKSKDHLLGLFIRQFVSDTFGNGGLAGANVGKQVPVSYTH